jgi:hypothetical protein
MAMLSTIFTLGVEYISTNFTQILLTKYPRGKASL